VRVERWLGFSGARWIAHKMVAPYAERAKFVRKTSAQAARELVLPSPADLIFIDACHDYESVAQDVALWSGRHLAPNGLLALHDSQLCPARPELSALTGPVALVRELVDETIGTWRLVATADSLSVLQRRAGKG
jgi:hypothetical protein